MIFERKKYLDELIEVSRGLVHGITPNMSRGH